MGHLAATHSDVTGELLLARVEARRAAAAVRLDGLCSFRAVVRKRVMCYTTACWPLPPVDALHTLSDMPPPSPVLPSYHGAPLPAGSSLLLGCTA